MSKKCNECAIHGSAVEDVAVERPTKPLQVERANMPGGEACKRSRFEWNTDEVKS